MKRLCILILVLGLAACTKAYSLVPPGPVKVVKSSFSVSPGEPWNKAPKGPAKSSEMWTRDGVTLDTLTFYGKLRGGTALLKKTKDQTLPIFRVNMLASDIAELIEATYISQFGSQFQILGLKPRSFGGVEGFEMEYAFTNQNDLVPRRGLAAGGVKNNRLYLILYEAPAMHYFERNRAAALRVMDSARIP